MSCNGVPYTPKGDPNYIGLGCDYGTIGGGELTMEGDRYAPSFCQKNCKTKKIVRILDANEEKRMALCECPGAPKWFPIENVHTYKFKCGEREPFNPQNSYCYNNVNVVATPQGQSSLCGNKSYDLSKQVCIEGVIYNKPPPPVYNWFQQAYQIPRPPAK